MRQTILIGAILGLIASAHLLHAQDHPWITTSRPITLLSANDGELDTTWRQTDTGLIDYEIKTRDSFTVIRLFPDKPPTTKTYYGKVPCTIIGTPSMAMSKDGRFGLITNHGMRFLTGQPVTFAQGPPLTNDDIEGMNLATQDLAPPLSNMMSMIDLSTSDCPVVDRVLFDDEPAHVLAHPNGKHFIVAGSSHFYAFTIEDGKLIKAGASEHQGGLTCFWINPSGNRILATQGEPAVDLPTELHWYGIESDGENLKFRHLAQVHAADGVDAKLNKLTAITRINLDGTKALVCQRAVGAAGELSDVLVVDLTANPPVISGVIEQVGDGVESFAFHPNGKMAVATCLDKHNNSIVVLDLTHNPPKILYNLDTGGYAQGIEFDPDGEKLFVGSAFKNRIEVFDVVGDFELRKNPKFLKTGNGHCSLTVGPTPDSLMDE